MHGDEQKRLKNLEETRRGLTSKLKEVFNQLDTDASGTVNLQEAEKLFENKRAADLMQLAGFELNEADFVELFHLMDAV